MFLYTWQANMEITVEKQLLRRRVRDDKRRYENLLPQWSATIAEQLYGRLSGYQTVMAYWPLGDEVDIRPLVERLAADCRTVLLPVVVGDDRMELRRFVSRTAMGEGAFHILEPLGEPFIDFDLLDVALVPGMAFDAQGRRLGRGRGYYDRFLASHPDIYKIGVCFPFQCVEQVPAEPHDVLMDELAYIKPSTGIATCLR